MDREKIENNRETIEKDRLENISRKILVMARRTVYEDAVPGCSIIQSSVCT